MGTGKYPKKKQNRFFLFILQSTPNHLDVKTYIPHPALQDFVLSISTVHAVLPVGVKEVVTPYPPTPFQSMMFYCNDAVSMAREADGDFNRQPLTVLVGPQYSRVNVKVHQRLAAVRVDFLPGGMFRMLGMPMHELFDGGFDAIDFFGAPMKGINEQLQHITSMLEGKTIVEQFLLSRLPKIKAALPLDDALRILVHHNGNMPVGKTASLSCLSLKQFERKCQERLGMNPKMYSRILRFSKAYRMHEALPQLSWISIAHEAGYFDQMHMIRDFRVFAGVNPSVIQQQLSATPLRMQKDLPY